MSLGHAKEHIFERVSVARDYELFTAALNNGRGRIELGELQGALERQVSRGEAFRYQAEIATQASLDRERAMVATINRRSERSLR